MQEESQGFLPHTGHCLRIFLDICNNFLQTFCKEIIVKNGMTEEDVFSAKKRWGYFSNKDNEVHVFDLCEACYDQWIATFAIPVDQK